MVIVVAVVVVAVHPGGAFGSEVVLVNNQEKPWVERVRTVKTAEEAVFAASTLAAVLKRTEGAGSVKRGVEHS